MTASDLLWRLLTESPAYRRRWQVHARRRSNDRLSNAAVATVLTHYLWESGERADSETTLARSLRDRVRRALNGEQLTAETLGWFIEAFDMDAEDADMLRAALAGEIRARHDLVRTVSKPRPLLRRQWHRTQALFERYFVDGESNLYRRRSLQTIVALEDGVDSYLFNHEPVASVRVVHGGTLGTTHEYGGGLRSSVIMLDRTLARGDSASLEYEARYPPAHRVTEVRRAVRGKTQNIDMVVDFDTTRLPARVWWCAWPDHFDGGPVTEEPVQPSDAGSVRWFLRLCEQSVIGFRWEW